MRSGVSHRRAPLVPARHGLERCSLTHRWLSYRPCSSKYSERSGGRLSGKEEKPAAHPPGSGEWGILRAHSGRLSLDLGAAPARSGSGASSAVRGPRAGVSPHPLTREHLSRFHLRPPGEGHTDPESGEICAPPNCCPAPVPVSLVRLLARASGLCSVHPQRVSYLPGQGFNGQIDNISSRGRVQAEKAECEDNHDLRRTRFLFYPSGNLFHLDVLFSIFVFSFFKRKICYLEFFNEFCCLCQAAGGDGPPPAAQSGVPVAEAGEGLSGSPPVSS